MARKRVGPRAVGTKSLSVPIKGQTGRHIRRCLEQLGGVLAAERDGWTYWRVPVGPNSVQRILNELARVEVYLRRGQHGISDGVGVGYANPVATGGFGGKERLA